MTRERGVRPRCNPEAAPRRRGRCKHPRAARCRASMEPRPQTTFCASAARGSPGEPRSSRAAASRIAVFAAQGSLAEIAVAVGPGSATFLDAAELEDAAGARRPLRPGEAGGQRRRRRRRRLRRGDRRPPRRLRGRPAADLRRRPVLGSRRRGEEPVRALRRPRPIRGAWLAAPDPGLPRAPRARVQRPGHRLPGDLPKRARRARRGRRPDRVRGPAGDRPRPRPRHRQRPGHQRPRPGRLPAHARVHVRGARVRRQPRPDRLALHGLRRRRAAARVHPRRDRGARRRHPVRRPLAARRGRARRPARARPARRLRHVRRSRSPAAT